MLDSETIRLKGSTLEWLEADGLGGFASGTVSGIRTRRYHALLLAATSPPAGRMVLVNGFDAWLQIGVETIPLSSQAYAPDYRDFSGRDRMISFTKDPWPRWIFTVRPGVQIVQELFVPHDNAAVTILWRVEGELRANSRLFVRPFFSGRDFHALQRENAAFAFEPVTVPGGWRWKSYPGVPPVHVKANAVYRHDPLWYRNFTYAEEEARGLDSLEDLAAPGVFEFDLANQEAVLSFHVEGAAPDLETEKEPVDQMRGRLACRERTRRSAFPTPLHRSADAYTVRRGPGKTIIAGYPWFGDWGRDTFIAMRGLCITTGRLDDAEAILLEWAETISEGMLPNRFPDSGQDPEYNSVDASLWYVIAVHDFLEAAGKGKEDASLPLHSAIEAILTGYSAGTRFGIRMDQDGLLACGEAGSQLTWMDAMVGDKVITPRVGKPVEIQALWINALWIAGKKNERWRSIYDQAIESFRTRFWNEEQGCLHDVVDCWHERGAIDSSFRPNQIFAVGGLPLNLLEDDKALRLVASVEGLLWTSMGLRSLAPDEAGYAGHYEGGPAERDSVYHQGTVWPWLAGPFIEAWVRVRGNTAIARKEAEMRFLGPMMGHLQENGLDHLAEIADAESPHRARGCPFQAWSTGELLRIRERILREPS